MTTMTIDPELQEILDEILIEIAKEHFHTVETLEVRNSDSLDFHDLYVGSIKDALEHAFFAGCRYSFLNQHIILS